MAQRLRRAAASLRLAPLALLCGACSLLEPLPWRTGPGADPPDDPPDDPAADAGEQLDAAPPVDASAALDAALDAGLEADGGEASVPTCSADSECAADQYCARASRSCSARCDTQGICAGPALSPLYNRLVSDGEQVCYAAPDDGEAGTGYTVAVWDGSSAPPRLLARESSLRLLLVADGYCYYSAPALKRVPLAGGEAETVQELSASVRRAWLAPAHVWWTAPHESGLGVFRLARNGGGGAELFAAEQDANKLWEAGNSTHLFRRSYDTSNGASCSVIRAPITDLSAETSFVMSYSKSCSGALEADEQSLFYPQYTPVKYNLYSVDHGDPSMQVYMKLFSTERLMYQLRGDTIYSQSTRDASGGLTERTTFYRIRRAPDAAPEQLLSPNFVTAFSIRSPDYADDQNGSVFAVAGAHIVFSASSSAQAAGRLVSAPLAP